MKSDVNLRDGSAAWPDYSSSVAEPIGVHQDCTGHVRYAKKLAR